MKKADDDNDASAAGEFRSIVVIDGLLYSFREYRKLHEKIFLRHLHFGTIIACIDY